jgi:murein DD-endopeptidase MepM/ murein hydrolase activator NlpD
MHDRVRRTWSRTGATNQLRRRRRANRSAADERDEGELEVAAQPAKRASRRALTAEVEPDERRGWLFYGLAGLGISALGLAVAGSLALTTSAQTTGDTPPVRTPAAVTAPAIGAGTGTGPTMTKRQAAAVNTFARRPNLTTSDSNRSAALRTAILKEQAAQRAEELAKEAEDLARADRAAASDARQNKLTEGDRASGLAAAKLAEEKLRRAVAARVAAAVERQAHEAREDVRVSSTPRSSVDRSSTPTGGGSDNGSGSDNGGGGGGGVSPVPGAVIGAHFGQYGVWSRYHTGIDFRAAYGTPIRAVKSGVVLFAGNKGDWAGNHVAVRHGDGMTTMSSHMSSMAVGSGQTVQAGQVIGYVGQTGRAFGAHLHFELYPVGVRYGDVYRAINPQPWLAANGVQTN